MIGVRMLCFFRAAIRVTVSSSLKENRGDAYAARANCGN